MSRMIQQYLSSYYDNLDISKEINGREKKMGDRRTFYKVNDVRGSGSQW